MVNAVVEVLDEGRSPFVVRQRIIKAVKSSPPGDVSNPVNKSKERIRKIVKKHNPNNSMTWDGIKWVQRRLVSSDYTSRVNELNEISLRTISSAASLAKMRQHQNKVKSGVQKMNSLATALKSAKDDTDRNRIDSQWRIAKGKVDTAFADMEWWSAFLTLSGSLGLEKSLIKKLKNTKRR